MKPDFFKTRSLNIKITTFTLLIFVISIWALTFYAGCTLRQDLQTLLGKQQLATVTFVANEVDQELSDRLQFLAQIAQLASPAMMQGSADLQRALDQYPAVTSSFNAGMAVLDLQGTVIAEVPHVAGRLGTSYIDRPHVIAALKHGQTNVGKPIAGREINAPLLPMATPIHDTQGRVIGALSGLIDLSQPNFLDEIFAHGADQSIGFLLIAPQHGLVVMSSNKSRIMAALPAPGVNALVDRELSGFEGSTIGVDPLNDEVLTSVKRVPVAGWLAVVRMTTTEAFAPIAALQRRLLLAATLLTLLAGALTWWLIRHHLVPLRAASSAVAAISLGQQSLRALPVVYPDEVGQLVDGFNTLLATLARRESLLKQIFDTASVSIFLVNKEGHIKQANQRMTEMFGRPLAELEGGNYLDLVHPTEREEARQNTMALIASVKLAVDLDRHYWRGDQTPFWGHLTCRNFVDQDGESTVVCVIVDVTARKLAYEKNQSLTRLYAALSQSNDAIVHSADEGMLFERVCRVLVQVGGFQTVFVGRANAQQQIQPIACFGESADDICAQALALAAEDPSRRGLTATAWCTGAPVWCQDYQADQFNNGCCESAAKLGCMAAASLPLLQDGRVVAVLTLFAAHANVFDDDMRRLLLEMTTNIGFALETYASARQRDASEQKVHVLMESINDAIITADSQGRIVGWNHAAQKVFGYSAAEAVGCDLTLLMPQRFQTDHRAGMQRMQSGQPQRTQGKLLELMGVRRDGSEFAMEMSLAKWDGTDDWYVTSIIRDISERKAQERQLVLAGKVFAQGHEGITVTDATGNIVLVNQAFTNITGYTQNDVLGQNPRLLHSGRQSPEFYRVMWQALTTEGHWAGEIINRKKDGTLYPEWLSISALRDEHNQVINYVANFSDLSETKKAENRILWLSHYDPLTGLPNRTLLQDRTQQALSMVQRASEPLTMMLVSIDHFGAINDSLGHRAGDQVLIETARRLGASVREQDTVSRLGGKEFVLVLPGTSSQGAVHLAQVLLNTLSQPCRLETQEVSVTVSIGISNFLDNGRDFDALFKAGEIAMRRAQANGRNTYQFYSADLYEQTLARDAMIRALRLAVALDQLQLVYQPQVDLQDGKICGLEALLRWTHPELGAVSPVQFIPLAEEAGLIVAIGEWVLQRACLDIRHWIDAGLAVPHVAVNVSPLQFHDNDLVAQVANALNMSQIDPALIYVEVTESALMDDVPRNEAMLRSLKDLGVKLSLDDFGTGYSALSYLKRFPFDQVKIDQSFVRDITCNASDHMLVGVIISMAHGFGMKVIAEGVETEAQCEILRTSICDEIQGYFFSRPISAQAIEEMFAEGRQLPAHLLRLQKPQRTLLLVDDEPNIVSALKRLFRRDGYAILTANSGEEGLALLAAHKIDLIISDQRMPGMTGVEFLRAAKALYPDTIRIVLSGYTELQSVTDAINEGAVYRFLTKPWEDEPLREQISKAFEYKEVLEENRQLDIKIHNTNQELIAVNRQLGEVLERKRHQIARDESSLAIAREAMQHMPLPVLGVDDEGLIAFVNLAAERQFASAGPLLGVELAYALPAIESAVASAPEGTACELRLDDATCLVSWHLMGTQSRSRGKIITVMQKGPNA